jgi:hypothetical protein
MDLPDPFYGYSTLLNVLIYVVLPLFAVLQFFRLRRALHVFQLEGYKRSNFLRWVRANPKRARWMSSAPAKKPLAMTGRAWRILIASVVLSVAGVFGSWVIAHLLLGGWPADVIAYLIALGLLLIFSSHVQAFADLLLTPVQNAINSGYTRRARANCGRSHWLVRKDFDEVRYREVSGA